jgi:serine/threonine-protein kinase
MIGSTLGGVYRILELIGGGGFADVYLARDLRSNAVVALKVLHPHMARDPAMLERFDREARLAQRLSEPHIVRILDSGQDGGTRYIAMEYVQGHTLDQLLRQKGRLSATEAIGLGCQVLQALETAHSAGVVHRDIKPQNLMLTSGGVLKVMDFGIAKLPASGTRTRIGTYLGTPEYMSPEQAKGETVDGRSDLYSLGITLFELLSGRPPFKADSEWKTLDLHVHAPPPRLTQFRTDVPGALADALLRALQKQPGERFQTAEQMRLALVAAGREQAAQPQQDRRSTPATGVRPTAARTGLSSRRSQWIPISAAALTLTFFGALLLASTRASQSDSLSAAPTANPPAESTAGSMAARASAPQGTPLPAERLQAAQAAFDARRFDEAPTILDGLRQSEPNTPGLSDLAYRAQMEYGKALLDEGDLDSSWTAYSAALDIRPNDAAALEGQKHVALAKNWRVMEAAWGKDDEAAIRALEEIIELDQAYGETRQKLYALLISKADRLLSAGDRDAAFATLTRALQVLPEGGEAQRRLAAYTPTPTPTPPPAQPKTQSPPPPPSKPQPPPPPPPAPPPPDASSSRSSRPTPTPTRQPDPDVVPCKQSTVGGGYGVTRTVHQLGSKRGTFRFVYDTFDTPDIIEIFYEGKLIWTTGGYVRTNGNREVSISYGPGSATTITVVVTNTQNTDTQWRYTVYCAS